MRSNTLTWWFLEKKGAVIRPDTSLGLLSIQIRMAPIWHPEKKVWQLWDCASEPDDLHAAGYFASGYTADS